MSDINPERYTVRVPEGARVSDAVAAHRDRTGYGGAVVLVFAHAAVSTGATELAYA
jgi:hypothetical protein